MLNLVGHMCGRVAERGGLYFEFRRGIPLGCPLSPLLGAFFLKELDDRRLGSGRHETVVEGAGVGAHRRPFVVGPASPAHGETLAARREPIADLLSCAHHKPGGGNGHDFEQDRTVPDKIASKFGRGPAHLRVPTDAERDRRRTGGARGDWNSTSWRVPTLTEGEYWTSLPSSRAEDEMARSCSASRAGRNRRTLRSARGTGSRYRAAPPRPRAAWPAAGPRRRG